MVPQLQLQRVEERTLTDTIYDVLDGRAQFLGAVAGELHLENSDRTFEYRGCIPLIGERGSRPLTDVVYRINIEDGEIRTLLVANGLILSDHQGKTEDHTGIIGEKTMLLLYQAILAGNYHPLAFASANGALVNQATSLERGEVLTLDRLPILSAERSSFIQLTSGEERPLAGVKKLFPDIIIPRSEPTESRALEQTLHTTLGKQKTAAKSAAARNRLDTIYAALAADGDIERFDSTAPVMERGKIYARSEIFTWVAEQMHEPKMKDRLNAAVTKAKKRGEEAYGTIGNEHTASLHFGVGVGEGEALHKLLLDTGVPSGLVSLVEGSQAAVAPKPRMTRAGTLDKRERIYNSLAADGDIVRFDPENPVVEEGKLYARVEIFDWLEKKMGDSGFARRMSVAVNVARKKDGTGYRTIKDERTAGISVGVGLIEGGELVRLLTRRRDPITLISLESAVVEEVAAITEKTVVEYVSKFTDEMRAAVGRIVRQRNTTLCERLIADGDATRFDPENPVVEEGKLYIRSEVFSWVEKEMGEPGLLNRLNAAAAYQIEKGRTGYRRISDERTASRARGVSLIEGGELVRLLMSRRDPITLISLESAVAEAAVEAPVPPPEPAPTLDPRWLNRRATVPSAPVELTREQKEEFGLACYEISFHPSRTYRMGSVMRELFNMTRDIATSRRLLEMAQQEYGERNGGHKKQQKTITKKSRLKGSDYFTLITTKIDLAKKFVRQITLEDEEAST